MIGILRNKLTLQQEARSADSGGGGSLSWQDVTTFWGAVEPLAGAESVRADALAGHLTHRIYARYDSRFAPELRIQWGSRLFNIRAVKNTDERGRFVEILAQEGVAT